jgi:hypothetical protein
MSDRDKPYYSVRTGKNPRAVLELPDLRRMFLVLYRDLRRAGYFDESFGSSCVDSGDTPGTLGEDIEGILLVELRKSGLWPIDEKIDNYSEDDLFDMIEFFFDHISKPIDGYCHSFNDCGMHWSTFNREQGQSEFEARINRLLGGYAKGFSLSRRGEILEAPDPGMATLIDADLPAHDANNVEAKVRAAIEKFRRHRASLDDRRDALRDLADVLEFLRPQIRAVLSSQDESDLFNLANNFGIRHHNQRQKTGYERPIWYSWMFYYYLATVHACLRLLAKRSGQDKEHAG